MLEQMKKVTMRFSIGALAFCIAVVKILHQGFAFCDFIFTNLQCFTLFCLCDDMNKLSKIDYFDMEMIH